MKNKYNLFNVFFIFSVIFLLTLQLNFDIDASHTNSDNKKPIIFDDGYEIEKFAEGFRLPSTMVFIGDDLLVIEKNTGKIFHVYNNGVRDVIPVLDLSVVSSMDGGLLGITAIKNHVYLFFSQSQLQQDSNVMDNNTKDVLYQFTWDGNKLVNPVLIKSFDGSHYHKSGVLTTDKENYVYLIRGDGDDSTSHYPLGGDFESGIFKISDLDLSIELYGVGIRNSFGIGIDPITGYLWETENGDHTYDEINLIKKGFHGGWDKVVGPSSRFDSDIQNNFNILSNSIIGNFTYYEPKFSWYHTIGPTFIAFPDDISFDKYKEWLFTGESNNSNIYKFHLNPSRDEFIFSDHKLSKDLVLDGNDNNEEIVFAKIPGSLITDVEFHHTGMYLISYLDGVIYRIFPKDPLPINSQYAVLGNHSDNLICKKGLMIDPTNKTRSDCISLKLGFSKLSEYKTKNTVTKINARNQNLQEIELKNLNLSYSDFRNATFGHILLSLNFTKTNLSNTDLSNKDLTGTILTGADLTGSNLTNVDLSNKDLTGTILTGADLTGSNLRNIQSNQELENLEMYDNRIKDSLLDTIYNFVKRNFNNFLNMIFN